MEKENLKEWAAKWNYIFWQASKLVGAPVLFCLMLLFMQKLVFTGTCAFAGYQCQQSLSYATNIAASVNKAVSDDGILYQTESESDAERFAKIIEAENKKKKH